ncbi:Protein of unknown function DUF3576 [Candidatus Pelagibacterales bacterium]
MKAKLRNFLYIFLLFLISCSSSKEGSEQFEPNVQKRVEAAAKKDGGIILFGGDKKNSGSIDFSSTNVMWRAALKTLKFMPLVSADYSAGLIVTDWYSEQKLGKEQIKIQVSFLSNDLKSESIVVSSFKRICEPNGICTNSSVNESVNKEIKDSIITNARLLKIEETKNKKP